ncbi:MAG: short-chain dehydrogenase/reductase [Acidimicrobiales bacterium]|nr:short-chain dehydrogenase/reductase [Acidimicrobiales bacterium]
MEPDPHQWNVIVTGGSSGLGAAIVTALEAEGAHAIIFDRRPPDAVDCPYVEVDLARTIDAENAVRQVLDDLGSIDAVVTCAGIDAPGPLEATPRNDWERVIAVNLLGTAAVLRAAIPCLRERSGRVVTVASTLGHHAVSDGTAYCASKFGVVGFTRALMAELRDDIGVTLITPGGMSTHFFDGRSEQYAPPPDARLADPADVAQAVVFALSRPAGVEVKELVITGPAEGTWP